VAYGSYEIITYGGGQTFVSVIQAVALLSGNSALKSMMTVALLVGLLMGILKAAFDFNLGAILRWLIMSTVIYGVLWLPAVTVHVTDRFNAGLQSADIAHVPLGVAFAAAFSTEVGDTAITVTQTAFNDPPSLQYANTGMIYGARLYGQMTSWQSLDPSLANNLQAYIQDCIADDLIANTLSLDAINNAPSLWPYLETHGNPTVMTHSWAEPSAGAPPAVTQLSCQAAAAVIDSQWPAAITESQGQVQRILGFSGAQGTAQTPITQTVSDLTGSTFGAATSATDFFKQALTISALKQSVAGYSGLAGGSTALQTFSNLQAQSQNNATSASIGQQAGTAIPILQMVMILLFIGMFPIMTPAFLLPSVGPKMIQSYFGSFIFLQLWGPMYVILNKIFLGVTLAQTASSAYLPTGTSQFGGQTALTLANLASAASTNQQIANVAGMMMMAIPVIAGLLTKGAMDGGGAAISAIAGFRSAGEAAGMMQATRNVSLGNTSLDTTQFQNTTAFGRHLHNTSANQDIEAPLRTQGAPITRTTLADGSVLTSATDGTIGLIANNSAVPISARLTTGLTNSAGVAARDAQQQTQAITDTWSKATTRTQTAMTEAFQAFQQGRNSSDTTGSDTRGSTGWVYSTLTNASGRLQRDLGLTKTEANSAVLDAATRGSLSFGSGPIPGLSGNISGITGLAFSQSKSSNATESVRKASEILEQEGYSTKVDQTRQAFATQVLGDTNSRTEGYRSLTSSTFANQASVSQALSTSQNQTKTFERIASQTQSTGWQQTTDYTNAMVNDLRRKLSDPSRPLVDANHKHWTPADLGALINPVGSDRDQVANFRDEVLHDFNQSYLTRLATRADPQIEADQAGTGQTAGLDSPGRFSLTPPPARRGPALESSVNARLGKSPLPPPTLPTVDPRTQARLAQDASQARQAEQTANGQTKDVLDRHPAPILDGPHRWFAPPER
jgi:conjugal transfer mating pair stabilization protein TraG